MTISAAERFISSSSLMPVGMPRPLSSTEIELSVWMVTTISSQKPASASSTALSTTSNTMWCRPVPSEVSPMYIPGRLRTASRPFRTLIASEPYSCSASLNSDPHRHDNVFEVSFGGIANERARRRVAEGTFDAFAGYVVEDVQQVVHVEADVERIARVAHLELLVRFFLLGVRRDDLQAAVGEHPTHAAEFFVGKDRRAQQRLAQRLARRLQAVLVARGNYACVIRKLAVDQLGDEVDGAEAERGLGGADLNLDRRIAIGEKLAELQHGLARNDDFLARQLRAELERGVSQPMTVGGDKLQHAVLDHHQQAVQIVPDVLLSHRVLHERKHPAQGLLLEFEARRLASGLGQARKILGRQGLQREAAFARPDHKALVLMLERHFRAVGKRTQDIKELARTHGDRAPFGCRQHAAARGDLDFDVGGEEGKSLAAALHEHVGENGQRVTALDDPAHCRERPEQLVPLCFCKIHFYLP